MHQQKPATKRKCFTNSALDKREEAQAERRTALLAYVAKQRTEHPDEMTNDDFTEIFTDQYVFFFAPWFRIEAVEVFLGWMQASG